MRTVLIFYCAFGLSTTVYASKIFQDPLQQERGVIHLPVINVLQEKKLHLFLEEHPNVTIQKLEHKDKRRYALTLYKRDIKENIFSNLPNIVEKITILGDIRNLSFSFLGLCEDEWTIEGWITLNRRI